MRSRRPGKLVGLCIVNYTMEAVGQDELPEDATNGCDSENPTVVSSSRWSSCASLGRASLSGVLGLSSNPPSPTMAPKCEQSPKTTKPSGGGGPKYKLVSEGDIQLCRLNHTRTIVSKIMNSKYLRRWETHHLVLGNFDISSTTVSKRF